MSTYFAHELEERYSNHLEELREELHELICDGKNNVAQFLASDALDGKLLQFVVLNDGTPRDLAEFSSRSFDDMALIDTLLNDTSFMKEILLADGPKARSNGHAQYGPAMKIYTNILNQTTNATWRGENIFSRLALAIALEHAVPILQNDSNANQCNQDTYVDPVRRYLNYETAYLNGELDQDFDTLSSWELRFVVDGNEPDEIAAWGRAMLRNYRPDHVLQRQYVRVVNSNVRYGSQDVKYDKDELQQYQNILMNGGVCGRRAFFGRFILRAFGIPTTARPSPGHGALVHWTPNQGWVVALGGKWGSGWTKTIYHKDLDFLATTQARAVEEAYWGVKKAQWVGDAMGEKRVYGDHSVINEQLGFWYNESLAIQRAIIVAFPVRTISDRDRDRPIALTERLSINALPSDANEILYSNENKFITIPAASFYNPRQAKGVQVMRSFQSESSFQIYLPAFASQGLAIMRGGTWKNNPNQCCSGARIMSGGYGRYEDWGFRVAISSHGDASSSPPQNLTIDLTGKQGLVKMNFVYIKPGSFDMGGESTSDGRFQCVEAPMHRVRLTKGFYLGKYPVTQAQYEAVTNTNPSKSTRAPDCPVDNIGDKDALGFCSKLAETIGRDFRLPTEAEWEYAARANQGNVKWFFGDDPSTLHEYAWFKNNSAGRSHPVGQLKPNPFGLYDIYGNVYERVSDRYHRDYYANSPFVDPLGPVQGTKSVFEYKVYVLHPGIYEMVAEVVTANYDQHLNISINGNNSSAIAMILPFTNGYWEAGPSVALTLKKGGNTIRIWRDKPPQSGVAIRKVTLEYASLPADHSGSSF